MTLPLDSYGEGVYGLGVFVGDELASEEPPVASGDVGPLIDAAMTDTLINGGLIS